MYKQEPLRKGAEGLKALNPTEARRLFEFIQNSFLIYGIRIPDNQTLRVAVVEPVVRRDSQAVNEALEVLVMNATPEELEKLMPVINDLLREMMNMAGWYEPSKKLLELLNNWVELNAEYTKSQMLEKIAGLSTGSETPQRMTIEEVQKKLASNMPEFMNLIQAIGELLRSGAKAKAGRIMNIEDTDEVEKAFSSKMETLFDSDNHGGNESAYSLVMDAAFETWSRRS